MNKWREDKEKIFAKLKAESAAEGEPIKEYADRLIESALDLGEDAYNEGYKDRYAEGRKEHEHTEQP